MPTDMENHNEVKSVARGGESPGVERVPIKVNGVEIEVAEEVLVRELVAKAKERGAIAGSVDEYVVERVTLEGEFAITETIRIGEHEEFLAVPVEPTTVASPTNERFA